MDLPQRIRLAAAAATKHLAISLGVALLAAVLVFLVWYPDPYRDISGGRELFTLLIAVDVVIGPLLTLVVFNPSKPRAELCRDLGVIAALQLSALGYGLHSVHEARPVLLAYEGNRFRAVSAAELDHSQLREAVADLRSLSHTGPRLVGVRLSRSDDPGYLESLRLSMEGFHPAYRPSRWVRYEQQRLEAAKEAKPLAELRRKRPEQAATIDAAAGEAGLPIERLGYIPLQSRTKSDWIVVLDRDAGWPRSFAHIDGW